ncbi:MAG: T9SS type A sorting domain-containing protein [Bacteroidetes bacterium]|nr:T9SS type A sorting domain-containing protein [Bacteroidota bacterium]
MQFLSQKLDTVYRLNGSDYPLNFSQIDTLRFDTVVSWSYVNYKLYNPQTKKLEYFWIKTKFINTVVNWFQFNMMDVYKDSTLLASGSTCGIFSIDTFRRRNYSSSYIKYISKELNRVFYGKMEILDTSFINPSNIYDVKNFSLNIYPSPVSDLLHIDFSPLVGFEIEFYNQNGQRMFIPVKSENVFDVSQLNDGVYYIELLIDGEKIHQRFIVRH